MNKIPNWMYDTPIAHRGYFDDASPENSLKAFQNAIDRGFAIELDVQILKDETLVVFHDESLERMTGKSGKLLESNYQDIKGLKLKDTAEPIPTFEDVLRLVDGQVPLMVEFKNESKNTRLERLGYDLLKSYKGAYVIQSFNPISVNWFKRNAPSVVRGQLSCRYENNKISRLTKFALRNLFTNVMTHPDYVIYDINALETPVINRLKRRGMPLFSYTAKSKLDYDYALKMQMPACFEGFDPQA